MPIYIKYKTNVIFEIIHETKYKEIIIEEFKKFNALKSNPNEGFDIKFKE